jgi:hypothetical protein
MKSHLNGLSGLILLGIILCGCGSAVPQIPVTEKDIPYTKQLTMKKDEAQNFQLPNGKIIAVWCERPDFPTIGEQATASGLKTAWGERPFIRPELVMKRQPDGSEVASGWKSYIEQGSVITYGSTRTSEYILYVDKWQFSIIEDLAAKGDLPVTIKVTERPKP